MLSLRSNDLLLPESVRAALRVAYLDQAHVMFVEDQQSYPEPSGHPALQSRLMELTPHWSGEVLVTNSATEALHLALSQVRSSGGRFLAVQMPCFFAVLRQAKALGLIVIPWARISELTAKQFDAVLLTSNFTPPNGQSMSEDDKAALARLADLNHAVVIEDNPYDPLWFGEIPTAVPADPARTIRIGSLSKIASPRFRLGFLRADGSLFKSLRSHKITLNLSTAPDLQAVCAAALTPNCLSVLRSELKLRASRLREVLCSMPEIQAAKLDIPSPNGGTYLSLPLGPAIDIKSFIATCLEHGLALDSNEHYYADGKPRPYIRLNYGAIGLPDIPQAALILVRVLGTFHGVGQC